jgi:hypothetical protein
MIKSEELRSELVDALESLDDADQAGKMLRRDTIAMLLTRLMEARGATLAVEER